MIDMNRYHRDTESLPQRCEGVQQDG